MIFFALGRVEELFSVEAAAAAVRFSPDVSGMSLRDAVTTLAVHGFGTEVTAGSGYVIRQRPRPGELLEVGRSCRLRLSERSAG